MSLPFPLPHQDIRSILHRANPEYRKQRSLSQVRILSFHWDDQDRPPEPYDHVARLQSQADYHIQKDWSPPNGVYGFGLMYHLDIEADGTIYFCNDFEDILWAVTNANDIAIAAKVSCGAGQSPTPEQLASAKLVADWAIAEPAMSIKRGSVYGHGELTQYGNSTQCPGTLLPFVQAFRKETPMTPTPIPSLPTSTAPTTPPPPQTVIAVKEGYKFFDETQHTVGHAFLDKWNAYNTAGLALEVIGYPIEEEKQETIGAWSGTVQYFQRTRMEWHTESGAGTVMFGLVGAELITVRGGNAIPLSAC